MSPAFIYNQVEDVEGLLDHPSQVNVFNHIIDNGKLIYIREYEDTPEGYIKWFNDMMQNSKLYRVPSAENYEILDKHSKSIHPYQSLCWEKEYTNTNINSPIDIDHESRSDSTTKEYTNVNISSPISNYNVKESTNTLIISESSFSTHQSKIYCYKCVKPLKEYTKCFMCDCILCDVCWDQIHSFYPLSLHKKNLLNYSIISGSNLEDKIDHLLKYLRVLIPLAECKYQDEGYLLCLQMSLFKNESSSIDLLHTLKGQHLVCRSESYLKRILDLK